MHPGYPVPAHLLPLMYWERELGKRPQDFVRSDIPTWKRCALALILKNGVDATPGVHAMGWADCRICGAMLGSLDLTGFGFVWPQRAEHYVLAHGIWTPDCSRLFECVLAHPNS